jgi:hypothetical protein
MLRVGTKSSRSATRRVRLAGVTKWPVHHTMSHFYFRQIMDKFGPRPRVQDFVVAGGTYTYAGHNLVN